MKAILLITALISFFMGLGIFSDAKSAIHEIASFMMFIMCVNSLGFFALLKSAEERKKYIQDLIDSKEDQ